MNDFTASNGLRIEVNRSDPSRVAVVNAGGHLESILTPDRMQALREFFQAETDERLGRWRWPADPDFIVYEPREGQRARVLRESTAQALDYSRLEPSSSTPSAFRSAAQDYFDAHAHPEPKPWDTAEDNEIWVLTGAGGLELPWRRTSDGEWESITPKTIRRRNVDLITAGRRIWPEVS